MSKLVFIGDSSVGKTCICNALCNNTFSSDQAATIGSSYMQTTITYNGKDYELLLWDTAGQEKYQAMTPIYFHSAKIALLVFSLTDDDSFNHIQRWLYLVAQSQEQVSTILIGNKCDLEEERTVSSQQCVEKAVELEFPYIEVSAKTRVGISELEQAIGEALENMEKEAEQDNVINIESTTKDKKKGCC